MTTQTDILDDVERALPHSIGGEKSVLSTLLKDPEDFIPEAIEAGITTAHFYLPAHRILFDTLVEIFERGLPIDLVSLSQKLLDRGQLDRIGGPSNLTELYSYAPSSASFSHHLRLILEKRTLRRLIEVSNRTIQGAFDSPEQASELLDAAEADIMAIRDTGPQKAGTLRNALMDVVSEVIDRQQGKAPLGLSTGIPDLDSLSTLKAGEVMVIAARPSMGKTAFALNIAEHQAVDLGTPTLIFSMEMSRQALAKRLAISRARISGSAIQQGHILSTRDLVRFRNAVKDISEAPLFIDESEALSISALRAKARRWKRSNGIQLIVIDYLQLMRSTSKQATGSREREVAEISAGIKSLAKELSIPIVLLAQLNRGPESRPGKASGIPRLSDLRESGSIEQDADLVGLLYRPAYYALTEEEKSSIAGQAVLIVAKNRNGATGHVPLTFIEDFARFEPGQVVPDFKPPERNSRSRFAHIHDK